MTTLRIPRDYAHVASSATGPDWVAANAANQLYPGARYQETVAALTPIQRVCEHALLQARFGGKGSKAHALLVELTSRCKARQATARAAMEARRVPRGAVPEGYIHASADGYLGDARVAHLGERARGTWLAYARFRYSAQGRLAWMLMCREAERLLSWRCGCCGKGYGRISPKQLVEPARMDPHFVGVVEDDYALRNAWSPIFARDLVAAGVIEHTMLELKPSVFDGAPRIVAVPDPEPGL